ncbi:hypothetical protein [Olleya namhaensis]|uniref:RiboL-PSP-HEPN domain-containing protein n=1 Tax=Olleya namhaensis TaxID=1144750 RepID=A0A1I3J773_9FLAO|nr:hypothetical protein [Olleya namhaensis]SFI55745.1 hypothetical protein SAMN05443431_101270 [Olleya namhaensis]
MKIKIPPYPNYKITKKAISDIEKQSVKKADSSGLSNRLVMVVKFKNGEERVIRSRPVRHLNNLYVSAFPNPVHLFLSVAIEHFNQSEEIKNTNFPKCGKQIGEDIYILDIEENGTHECYNHYIKYRSSSIVMLVASIEAFLNHIVPNDYKYKTQRTRNGITKDVVFSKKKIESGNVPFNEKIDSLIPQMLNKESFWNNLESEKITIKKLYTSRKNIIHLKTNAEDDLTAYFDAIDKMLDLNIHDCIMATTNFMNNVEKDFIEFEK